MKCIFAILTAYTLFGCNNCGQTEEGHREMEFSEGIVSRIDSGSCFVDYWLTLDNSDSINIVNCYCGPGDHVELEMGDIVSKKIGLLKFHNQRTGQDLIMNCCDY